MTVLFRFVCFSIFSALAAPTFAQEVEKPKPPVVELSARADYLALRVNAKVPEGATTLQYRFGESGRIAPGAEWLPAPQPPRVDRTVAFDLPLKRARWVEIEVRALRGGESLATARARHEPGAFTLLTPERIAALPQDRLAEWTAYLERSRIATEAEFDRLAAECRDLKQATSQKAPEGDDFESDRDPDDPWFASEGAKSLAEVIISYQTPAGGWSKAVNYGSGPRAPGTHWTSQGEDGWHYCGTLDNRSTTEQIRFLASFHGATKDPAARESALRGIEWLLAAQFPNGGWPQVYPVEPGYHEAVTLNDNAMTHALEVLLAVARGRKPYGFVSEPLRDRARAAFDRGIQCVAAAQVAFEGSPSVWCAQHDPLTLEPVGARAKEPPALSGGESADLLKFLMREAPGTDEIITIVEPAVAWLDAHRIRGLRKAKNEAGKTDYVPDPASPEVYWARFYHPATAKPMFAGSQDGIVYDTYSEMAAKNKVGYDYFSTRPRDIIEKEVARWKKRLAKEAGKD